ncbi:FAD-dependent oxidoreductase [Corallibacter vietnamensis]|uniref:FAD-dependent oxidoreductase n=1 Tax=Corallibacter vietnamensis TaxID=904130 RepID=A0ABP7GZE2_9FLAO
MEEKFEVIIIGGSYAGLSAAMALGRSLRKVLIIDSGLPCNRQTLYSHNFITQDGVKPGVISSIAKKQVLEYKTVEYLNDKAVKTKKIDKTYKVDTESGKTFSAQKIVFATGIKDNLPKIKGFSECWGISVVHCPYCHGYELRGKNTAIIANDEKAIHLASLVNNLTSKITICTNGKATFNTEQKIQLARHDINIVEKQIIEIIHKNGSIEKIVFTDNTTMAFEAAYGAVPFTQHSNIPESLGCKLTEQGYIDVDMFGKTSEVNIYACGDNSSPMRSVANAVSKGNFVGAFINMELTKEQF